MDKNLITSLKVIGVLVIFGVNILVAYRYGVEDGIRKGGVVNEKEFDK